MFIMPSLKKSLIVEQFQGNYLKAYALDTCLPNNITIKSAGYCVDSFLYFAVNFCEQQK